MVSNKGYLGSNRGYTEGLGIPENLSRPSNPHEFNQLRSRLKEGAATIPEERRAKVPLLIFGTAGMRLRGKGSGFRARMKVHVWDLGCLRVHSKGVFCVLLRIGSRDLGLWGSKKMLNPIIPLIIETPHRTLKGPPPSTEPNSKCSKAPL